MPPWRCQTSVNHPGKLPYLNWSVSNNLKIKNKKNKKKTPHEISNNCHSFIIITVFTADVVADVFLLSTSLHLFVVIQDKALRIRLSSVFSTCVLTTVVSFVNSSFILNSEGTRVTVVAVVEVHKISFSCKSLTIEWHLEQRISYCRQHPSSLQCVYISQWTHFSQQRRNHLYSFRAAYRYRDPSIRNTNTRHDWYNDQNIARRWYHGSSTTSRSRVKSRRWQAHIWSLRHHKNFTLLWGTKYT